MSFLRTRVAFDAALRAQRGGGASLAVAVDGREVLALSGGEAAPGRPWTHDTRTHLMSVTKGFAGLVVAMLVDRGLLDVDERVAHYWPEFAAQGKQDVTVRMVLLHTSGVIGLDRPGVVGRDGGWGDLDRIAASLADATPAWEPGARGGYHAVTYGWLVGELVRRTDGRTLGTFFLDEVAGPLGLRAAVGLAPDDLADVAVLHALNDNKGPVLQRPLQRRAKRLFRDPSTLPGKAGLGDGSWSVFDQDPAFFSTAEWLTAEVPSSNGVSSARDLARLFAVFAQDGAASGVRLLDPTVLAAMTAPCPPVRDDVMAAGVGVLAPLLGSKLLARRCLALQTNGGQFGSGPRAVGAEGAGGQLAYADPDRRLSVGFVRSTFGLGQKEIRAIVTAIDADLS